MSQTTVSRGMNTAPGKIIQVVNTQTGAVATGTTLIANDDTIPQIGEGDQYMSLAITPTNASNKLLIEVVAMTSHGGTIGGHSVALFQDSTSNALATDIVTKAAATHTYDMSFSHYMAAGTTSSTTFKVRIGASNSGTTTFNGQSGGRKYGGTLASSITITEIEV